VSSETTEDGHFTKIREEFLEEMESKFCSEGWGY